MKYHFLFFFLAVSATVSCSQTAIEESPAPDGTAQTGTEEAFTSEIEIKLSEELAEEVGEDLAGGCLQTKSVKFNDLVAADTRVEKVILPLRDGLTIIRKK